MGRRKTDRSVAQPQRHLGRLELGPCFKDDAANANLCPFSSTSYAVTLCFTLLPVVADAIHIKAPKGGFGSFSYQMWLPHFFTSCPTLYGAYVVMPQQALRHLPQCAWGTWSCGTTTPNLPSPLTCRCTITTRRASSSRSCLLSLQSPRRSDFVEYLVPPTSSQSDLPRQLLRLPRDAVWGAVILLLHDMSDIFLCAAKSRYIRKNGRVKIHSLLYFLRFCLCTAACTGLPVVIYTSMSFVFEPEVGPQRVTALRGFVAQGPRSSFCQCLHLFLDGLDRADDGSKVISRTAERGRALR